MHLITRQFLDGTEISIELKENKSFIKLKYSTTREL